MNDTPARPAGPLRELFGSLAARGGDVAIVRRNIGWLITDKIVRLAVGLIVNVWIVRALGATRLGLLSFAQSLVGLFAIAAQLAIDSILVRQLVRHPDEADAILGSGLALRLGGAVASIALSLVTVAVVRPHDAQALALGAAFAIIPLCQSLDVIEHWFQGRQRVQPFVIARAAAFGLATVARVLALVLHAPLVVLAMAISSEFALAALALVVAYRLDPPAPRPWRMHAATARALFRDSWPLLANNAAALVAIRIDQVMLTTLRGEHENGIYASAQRLTEALFFVPLAVSSAAAPALLRSYGSNAPEYWRRLGRLFFVLGWIAILVAVPVSLASGWITRTLYGPAFAASGAVLAIHIWSAPALFSGVAMTNWFVAEGRQRALLVRSLTAAGLNVALNLWLIPVWGARGAALATLVSLTFAHIVLNGLVPSTRALFRVQVGALWPGRGERSA